MMPETPENLGQMMMLLGELRGQVRELVHSVNNLRQDVGTVFDKMAAQQNLPSDVARNAADIAALKERVGKLETTESERRGAVRFGAALVRVLPWTVPFAAFGAGIAFMQRVMGT